MSQGNARELRLWLLLREVTLSCQTLTDTLFINIGLLSSASSAAADIMLPAMVRHKGSVATPLYGRHYRLRDWCNPHLAQPAQFFPQRVSSFSSQFLSIFYMLQYSNTAARCTAKRVCIFYMLQYSNTAVRCTAKRVCILIKLFRRWFR